MNWLAAATWWQTMMLAMMVPVVWPWLRAVRQVAGPAALLPQARFATGYALAWLPFSLLLALIPLGMAMRLGPRAGAAVLLLAALYQFAPLKRACLRHCRNPLTELLLRWRGRGVSLLGLGARHGLVCVACCWALMATMLALGMMNVWWMLALAAAVFAEQVLPWGGRLRPLLGVGLVLAAGALLIA